MYIPTHYLNQMQIRSTSLQNVWESHVQAGAIRFWKYISMNGKTNPSACLHAREKPVPYRLTSSDMYV